MNYALDVIFLAIGIHFTTYIIYGRLRGKSLVGGYKPGVKGYDVFRKLVSNNKYFGISIIGTLFFAVNTFFDARSILHGSSSHSVLVAVPILVILIFVLMFALLPTILGKKR